MLAGTDAQIGESADRGRLPAAAGFTSAALPVEDDQDGVVVGGHGLV